MTMPLPRAAFLLRYDSFVRNHVPVAQRWRERGGEARLWVVDDPLKPWITREVEGMLAGEAWRRSHPLRLASRVAEWRPNVVFAGLILRRGTARMLARLRRLRPGALFVGGYIGAMLDNRPRGFVKGVQRRARLCDLIWTPGPRGRDAVLATGLVPPGVDVEATGLPSFDQLARRFAAQPPEPRGDILFLGQPTYPKGRAERLDLLRRLAALARARPCDSVLLKPRFQGATHHAHRPRHHYGELLAGLRNRPPNLEITHRPIPDLCGGATMALTLSSTGGIETMLAGVPTYFLDDWCAGSNRYGSDYFRDSAGVVSIERLIAGERPPVRLDWAREVFTCDGHNAERLVERVAERWSTRT